MEIFRAILDSATERGKSTWGVSIVGKWRMSKASGGIAAKAGYSGAFRVR